ncbi:MAG: inositol monophosphatase [Chloroflexi bacterium]|nr:MAG: inositol monophosphatase [Chloroflexota bacterium]
MLYHSASHLIERLSKEAGEALMRHFRKEAHLVSLRSSAKEAITTYDRMADSLIVGRIKEAYPEHSLLTEESGFLAGDPDWLWIVDSLDGTGNFANWNPLFSVCIALMHLNELVLAAVYAPAIDELYLAEKGNGAYLNNARISVSEVSRLGESYLLYCEGAERDRARTGRTLNRVYPQAIDIRKLGSAGLETAWVAAGRAEAYFTTSIDPWDVAAGVLLVSEGGGKVSDFRGSEWRAERSDLLFSNGRVHSVMMEILQES